MNGKDTHVRGMRILGPIEWVVPLTGWPYLNLLIYLFSLFLGIRHRGTIPSRSSTQSSKCTNIFDSTHSQTTRLPARGTTILLQEFLSWTLCIPSLLLMIPWGWKEPQLPESSFDNQLLIWSIILEVRWNRKNEDNWSPKNDPGSQDRLLKKRWLVTLLCDTKTTNQKRKSTPQGKEKRVIQMVWNVFTNIQHTAIMRAYTKKKKPRIT